MIVFTPTHQEVMLMLNTKIRMMLKRLSSTWMEVGWLFKNCVNVVCPAVDDLLLQTTCFVELITLCRHFLTGKKNYASLLWSCGECSTSCLAITTSIFYHLLSYFRWQNFCFSFFSFFFATVQTGSFKLYLMITLVKLYILCVCVQPCVCVWNSLILSYRHNNICNI